MTEFNEWVRKRYLNPVVVVESSPLSDAACGRNGLDAIHLLRRYSSVSGPLQASLGEKGETVVVRHFGVRFQRTDCVREVAPSQILRHVRHQIWRAAELDLVCGEQLDRVVHDKLMESDTATTAGAEGIASASITASAAAASVVGPSPRPQRIMVNTTAFNTLLERSRPPWHSGVVRDLHHLVRATPFETIDYPIGVMHVVSTNEPGGVDGVLKMLRAQLKRVHDMRTDLVGMETDVHTFYVLLHDLAPAPAGTPAAPTLREAQTILAAMKQLYGDTYCALVKLNSGAVTSTPPLPSDPTPWVDANPVCMDVPAYTSLAREQAREASRQDAGGNARSSSSSVPATLQYRSVKTHFTPASGGDALTTGCFLTRDDLMELESTMAYYVGQSLFRYLERRLRGLDVAVQDRRTTTLRKVAAWLSLKDESKPRTASVTSASDGGAPRYLATSVEMQMRRCGDLCLAFRHYDMAADYYKMCMEELIQTLPDRPYNKAMIAACQEAIGIALLLQDKLQLPTSTPWTVTASWTSTRSHNACRLEMAQPMYVGSGLPLCALRLSFLMAEFCRSRMPPAVDRTVGQLKHILRSGLVNRTPLFLALVHDMLASAYIFSNPPYPSGLLLPPSLPVSSEGVPVYSYVRRFAALLMTAGQHYQTEGVMDGALRCFLRVLEVFRSLGKARSWPTLYERLLDRISTLYYALGYDVKGLAMSSVAVVQGCHQYSDPLTGYTAFEAFWHKQEQVLTGKGFSISAHMVVPEVVRASMTIRRNTYAVDADTYHTTRQLGDVAASSEWRTMEHHLRTAMLHRLTRHEEETLTTASIATRAATDASAAPSTTSVAHSAHSAHAPNGGPSLHQQRLALHLPRGAHGAVKQLANDDVVLLSRTSSAVVTSAATATVTASLLSAGGARGNWGDSFVVAGAPLVKADGTAATSATSAASATAAPRFRMYLGEPLKVSVELYNPIGGPLTATGMCLLYVARGKPGPPQLWKTASTQTVDLAAQSRARVNLSFDPMQEGEFVIIGLCWSILGQEGYYYFATKESRPGCTESLFEYAMAHPMPNPDAPENVSVLVESSEAWLASAFEPPLPTRMRDGEYFHTTLVLQNKSTRGTARHITIQRSPQNAHLLFLSEFGLEKNLAEDAAFELTESLAPGQVKKLSVVFRAQHDRGDVALTCYNHVFLLFGFVSDAASPGSSPSASLASSATKAISVRVHRLLRYFEVTPLLLLYSTVLPPTGPSLDTACVLTVKHIPTSTRSTSSSSVAHHRQMPSGELAAGQPVSVARVLVMHEPRWRVQLAQHVEALFHADTSTGTACAVSPGSSLTMPLLVHRVSPDQRQGSSLSVGLGIDAETEASRFKDTVCLPLRRAVATEATARVVEANLGSGLVEEKAEATPSGTGPTDRSSAAANAFFLQTFFRGAGGAGSNAVDAKAGMEAMSFYKDKGASAEAMADASRSPAQRRLAEQRQETAMYGAPLETYTPIAVAVAWLLEETGGTDEVDPQKPTTTAPRVVCGQSFFLIDTMSFLETGTSVGGKLLDRGESALLGTLESKGAVASSSASLVRGTSAFAMDAMGETGTGAAGAAGSRNVATLQEQQERLSQALWSHNSPRGDRGALVYKVAAPPRAEASLSMPTAALTPITFTCLSLSPVPLMVEVSAHDHIGVDMKTNNTANGNNGNENRRGGARAMSVVAPLLFVGKTQETFYLPPSARHSLTFTVHILVPGVIDCNRLRVRATPLLFQPGVDGVRTGMAAAAFIRALQGDANVNVSASDSATVSRRRAASSGHSAAAAEAEAHTFASAAAAQTRAALQSLTAAQSRRRTVDLGSVVYSPVVTSPTSPNHRNEAHQAVLALALSLLTPRGFLSSHVAVVGAEVPAMVHVCFPRADVATQEAAATVFQRKNKVYHRDWHLFEANYAKFSKAQAVTWLEEREAQAKEEGAGMGGMGRSRQGGSDEPDATPGSRVHYVYRPRVKKAVEATGTAAVQLDALDKLLASPRSASTVASNISFSIPTLSTTTPPLKSSPALPSASAGGAAASLGQSHSSAKPRPPRLLLPEPLQTPSPLHVSFHNKAASGAGEVDRAEAAAQSMPDALFASPILHAAPPLTAVRDLQTDMVAVSEPSAAQAPSVVAFMLPESMSADGGLAEDDAHPLPQLSLGEDSDQGSTSPSRVHSTLLSPLHMPSPHRGLFFEHVMPVDSVRDLSEAEVAAAAEGASPSTIVVPTLPSPSTVSGVDDENDVNETTAAAGAVIVEDLFEASWTQAGSPSLATPSAPAQPVRVAQGTPQPSLDDLWARSPPPPPVAPVFSRVVEHQAAAHPLRPEDVLAADIAQGMPALAARTTGVVVRTSPTAGQPVVTGTPVRGDARATVMARGVSVGSTSDVSQTRSPPR